MLMIWDFSVLISFNILRNSVSHSSFLLNTRNSQTGIYILPYLLWALVFNPNFQKLSQWGIIIHKLLVHFLKVSRNRHFHEIWKRKVLCKILTITYKFKILNIIQHQTDIVLKIAIRLMERIWEWKKIPKWWVKRNSFSVERKKNHRIRKSPHITHRKFYLSNICAKCLYR